MALESFARTRIWAILASIAMTVLDSTIMRVLAVFDSFAFTVSQVLNPVWQFVGSVRVTAQTLYGYAAKAPYRLLVYDS